MLNILLSGPGLIGRQHMRLIQEHPECRLAAIVAPPSDENRDIAQKAGAPLFVAVEAALSSLPIDGAIIPSPNRFHFQQAMACIEHRVPALVEKPITDVVADARRLVEAAENTEVPILVGHHRTYSPVLEAAEQFIRSNDFGQIVALQGTALFYKPSHYFRDGPWRTQIGGGPILINLIHEVGLARLFGGEIKQVFAFASNQTRKFAVEDTVTISFVFENGALGSFLLSDTAASSRSWEMTSGENPSYPHFPDENCWHLAGTRGSLNIPSMHAQFYRSDDESSWWLPFTNITIPFVPRDPLKAQFDHFVDVILNRAPPRVTARDGYCNILVITAIQESIARQALINVSDIDDAFRLR